MYDHVLTLQWSVPWTFPKSIQSIKYLLLLIVDSERLESLSQFLLTNVERESRPDT
jgi:hypothetical protein